MFDWGSMFTFRWDRMCAYLSTLPNVRRVWNEGARHKSIRQVTVRERTKELDMEAQRRERRAKIRPDDRKDRSPSKKSRPPRVPSEPFVPSALEGLGDSETQTEALYYLVDHHIRSDSDPPVVLVRDMDDSRHLDWLEALGGYNGIRCRAVDGNLLIVEFPSKGHESASTMFLRGISSSVALAGLDPLLRTDGSALLRKQGARNKQSGEQPDQSFSYRLSRSAMPSLVLEVGWSETMQSLQELTVRYLTAPDRQGICAVVLLKFELVNRGKDPPRSMIAVVARRGLGVTEAVSFGTQECSAVTRDQVTLLHQALVPQSEPFQVTTGTTITVHTTDLLYGAKDNVNDLLADLDLLEGTPLKTAAARVREALSAPNAQWPMPNIVVDLAMIRDAVLESYVDPLTESAE